MNRRFSRRFASYLSKGDVRRLFYDVLVKKYGSVDAASRAAGISRKTPYNLNTVRDVRHSTKVKVLQAAYEADPLSTLRFLVKALRSRAGEALFTLIDYIKTEALRCGDSREVEQYARLLEEILEELGGPLRDEVKIEAEDVYTLLNQKSAKLKAGKQ